MAEKKQDTTVQEQPNENKETTQQEQPRPCPQDCRMCGVSQQVFCSTKMLFDMSRTIQALGQKVAEMETAIGGIQAEMQKSNTPDQLAIPFSEG